MTTDNFLRDRRVRAHGFFLLRLRILLLSAIGLNDRTEMRVGLHYVNLQARVQIGLVNNELQPSGPRNDSNA